MTPVGRSGSQRISPGSSCLQGDKLGPEQALLLEKDLPGWAGPPALALPSVLFSWLGASLQRSKRRKLWEALEGSGNSVAVTCACGQWRSRGCFLSADAHFLKKRLRGGLLAPTWRDGFGTAQIKINSASQPYVGNSDFLFLTDPSVTELTFPCVWKGWGGLPP